MVGVIDTGIDATHPDLSVRIDVERSRNFTTDIPIIDGECADDPDGSCEDGADVDENGHGTHVAGTVAASVNGYGIAGILPKATLVNLRAGQDSGFFFVDATVNALTYAGDIGVDVVNLSFYVDPWLYNCTANPDDSPEEQAEQATIIESVQRAVDYARGRGVTTIAALGNEATDLGNPTVDPTSPDFPPGSARVRTVDNSCLDVPTETDGVISVSSLGPSLRKADYSNYGTEQTDVSAPGGWFRDGLGTETFQTPQNMILSAWPAGVAAEEIAANGGVLPDDFVQYCGGEVCAYYKYIQGTSMAAPHATGVAALAVSYWGADDPERNADGTSRGRALDPEIVERILLGTAVDTPCPPGGVQSYIDVGRPPSFDAVCVGDADRNGFYGEGIVNAEAVIRYGAAHRD
jgi:subtilisin family serine protease